MTVKNRLLKTITWRITASLTTLVIVYIISGEIKTAGIVTLLEGIIKMIIYYFHETTWDRIEYDKNNDNSKNVVN